MSKTQGCGGKKTPKTKDLRFITTASFNVFLTESSGKQVMLQILLFTDAFFIFTKHIYL